MNMQDREKALENKYMHDQQKLFRIEARASKLIGLWAAEKMGLHGEQAANYAKEVIASNLDEPGYDDVKRKILKDFDHHEIEITPNTLDGIIEKKKVEAANQIETEENA